MSPIKYELQKSSSNKTEEYSEISLAPLPKVGQEENSPPHRRLLIQDQFIQKLHELGLTDGSGCLKKYILWPNLNNKQLGMINDFESKKRPIYKKENKTHIPLGEFTLAAFFDSFTKRTQVLNLSNIGIKGSSVHSFFLEPTYLTQCFIEMGLSADQANKIVSAELIQASWKEARDIDLITKLSYAGEVSEKIQKWIHARLKKVGQEAAFAMSEAMEEVPLELKHYPWKIILTNSRHEPLINLKKHTAFLVETFGGPKNEIDFTAQFLSKHDFRVPADNMVLERSADGQRWSLQSSEMGGLCPLQGGIDLLAKVIRLVDVEDMNAYCWGTLMTRLTEGWRGAGLDSMDVLMQKIPSGDYQTLLLKAILKRCSTADSAYITALHAVLCSYRHNEKRDYTQDLKDFFSSLSKHPQFKDEPLSPFIQRLATLIETHSFENVLAQLQLAATLGLNDTNSTVTETTHFGKQALCIPLANEPQTSTLLLSFQPELIPTQIDAELLYHLCPNIDTILTSCLIQGAPLPYGISQELIGKVALSLYGKEAKGLTILADISPALFAKALSSHGKPRLLDSNHFLTLLKKQLLIESPIRVPRFLPVWEVLSLDERFELLSWMIHEQKSLSEEWQKYRLEEATVINYALYHVNQSEANEQLSHVLKLLTLTTPPSHDQWTQILNLALRCNKELALEAFYVFCAKHPGPVAETAKYAFRTLAHYSLEEGKFPPFIFEQLISKKGPLANFLWQPENKADYELYYMQCLEALTEMLASRKNPLKDPLLQSNCEGLRVKMRLKLIQLLQKKFKFSINDALVSKWLSPFFKHPKAGFKVINENLELIKDIQLLKSLKKGALLQSIVNAWASGYSQSSKYPSLLKKRWVECYPEQRVLLLREQLLASLNGSKSLPMKQMLATLQQLTPLEPSLWRQLLKTAIEMTPKDQSEALAVFFEVWKSLPEDQDWSFLGKLLTQLQSPLPGSIREQLFNTQGPLMDLLQDPDSQDLCHTLYEQLIKELGEAFYTEVKQGEKIALLLKRSTLQEYLLLNCPEKHFAANQPLLEKLVTQLDSNAYLEPLVSCDSLGRWNSLLKHLKGEPQEIVHLLLERQRLLSYRFEELSDSSIDNPKILLVNSKKGTIQKLCRQLIDYLKIHDNPRCFQLLHTLSLSYQRYNAQWWKETEALWDHYKPTFLLSIRERLQKRQVTSEEVMQLSLTIMEKSPDNLRDILKEGLAHLLTPSQCVELSSRIISKEDERLKPAIHELAVPIFSEGKRAKAVLEGVSYSKNERLYNFWIDNLQSEYKPHFLQAWAKNCIKNQAAFPSVLHSLLLNTSKAPQAKLIHETIEWILELGPQAKFQNPWMRCCLNLLITIEETRQEQWHKLRHWAINCTDPELRRELISVLYQKFAPSLMDKQEAEDWHNLIVNCQKLPRVLLEDYIAETSPLYQIFVDPKTKPLFAQVVLHLMEEALAFCDEENKADTQAHVIRAYDLHDMWLRQEPLFRTLKKKDLPTLTRVSHRLTKSLLVSGQVECYMKAKYEFANLVKFPSHYSHELIETAKQLLTLGIQHSPSIGGEPTCDILRIIKEKLYTIETSELLELYLDTINVLTKHNSPKHKLPLLHAILYLLQKVKELPPSKQPLQLKCYSPSVNTAIESLVDVSLDTKSRQLLLNIWDELHPKDRPKLVILNHNLERHLLLSVGLSAVADNDGDHCLQAIRHFGERVDQMIKGAKSLRAKPLPLEYLFDEERLSDFFILHHVAQRHSRELKDIKTFPTLFNIVERSMLEHFKGDSLWEFRENQKALNTLWKIQATQAYNPCVLQASEACQRCLCYTIPKMAVDPSILTVNDPKFIFNSPPILLETYKEEVSKLESLLPSDRAFHLAIAHFDLLLKHYTAYDSDDPRIIESICMMHNALVTEQAYLIFSSTYETHKRLIDEYISSKCKSVAELHRAVSHLHQQKPVACVLMAHGIFNSQLPNVIDTILEPTMEANAQRASLRTIIQTLCSLSHCEAMNTEEQLLESYGQILNTLTNCYIKLENHENKKEITQVIVFFINQLKNSQNLYQYKSITHWIASVQKRQPLIEILSNQK